MAKTQLRREKHNRIKTTTKMKKKNLKWENTQGTKIKVKIRKAQLR